MLFIVYCFDVCKKVDDSGGVIYEVINLSFLFLFLLVLKIL